MPPRPRIRHAPSLSLAAALALAPLAAHAAVQGEGRDKAAIAARTAAAPVIDGRLDDAVWAEAPPDDRFTQFFPQNAAPPAQRTEVRVLYDDRAVYVAVRLFDTDPDGIVARLTRRDRDIETDWVALAFDSQHDHRTAYVFQLSASGVQLDGMFFDDSNFTVDWDAVWDGAVTRDDGGWNAEFAIPLSALRFSSAKKQEWGFQVMRYVSRIKETSLWATRPLNVQGEVSWFGHLTGLEGLKPARTFELRPFGVARVRARTDAGGALLGTSAGADVDGDPDLGLDVKIGITSNLTLDATVNPDFGQVEADQVILNLSRFETFFPEKRPFFLEGADVYQTPIQLFYSRRIGRPPSGMGRGAGVQDGAGAWRTVEEAPGSLRIWSAAKFTGTVSDDLSIGVLGAVAAAEEVQASGDDGTRTLELAPPRGFTVLRGRWSLGGGNYVGAMATAVNRLGGDLYVAEANHDAYAQGIDAFWQTRGGAYRLTGQLVASERVGGTSHMTPEGRPCPDPEATPGCVPITRSDGTRLEPGDVGYGAALQLFGRDGHLWLNGQYRMYSPELDVNDAGFLPQYNQHSLRLVAGWLETKPGKTFQSMGLFGFAVGSTTFDGLLEEAVVGVDFEAETRGFLNFSPELSISVPGGWDTRETLDGGRFERPFGANLSAFVGTDSRKKLVLRGFAWGFLAFVGDGHDFGGGASLAYQATTRLQVELSPEIGFNLGSLRYYACSDPTGGACTVETDERDYLFAELETGYLSVTARGTFTFSPKLSLQSYAQLFMDRGEYGGYREVTTTGRAPFVERADLGASSFTGDFDGDGKKDDDFQDLSLNVNVVLRWELLPGSALFVVYTRAQNAAFDLAGRRPAFQLSGLSTGPTEDVFLMKLIYFVS